MAETEQAPADMKQYYILGIVVLVAVVIAGYMLRPKTGMSLTTTPITQEVVPTPTPGPITSLACDSQYFNQKVAFAEYYLSVDGGDVPAAKEVECTFSASVSGKIVSTSKVTAPLSDAPQRGGKTFRCTTKAIELEPNVPTIVDISLKDDLGETATCSGAFTFPAP